MTKSQVFLRQYLMQGSADALSKQAAKQVAEIISDRTVKKTEVIREKGFVHGRVRPVPRSPS